MGRLAVLVSVVCLLLLGVAAPVWAHTELASSDPSDGAKIDGPLDTVTLTFSRPIELAGKGVQVLDENGEVVTADVDVVDEIVTVQPRQAMEAGRYGVRWAVRSGDAHPVRDSFRFTVRSEATADVAGGSAAAAPAAPNAADTDGAVGALDSALAADPVAGLRRLDQGLRALFYTVALGALGVFVFLLVVWDGPRREARRLTRLTSRLAAVGAAVVVVQVVVRAARTAGGWSGTLGALPSTLSGPYAAGTALRLVGAVLLMAGLFGLRRVLSKFAVPIAGGAVDLATRPVALVQPRRISPARRVAAAPAATLGAVLLVVSFAFIGHAATAEPRVVARAAVMAHVAAGAIWGGGLLALVVVVWSRHRARRGYRAGLVVARFSVLAAGGVGLAALAGIALAAVRLASVSALWTTSYGLALLAKVAVVAVVGGMGAYNHFVVVPALRSDAEHAFVHHLRWLGLAEVLLLVVVASVTSLLVGLAG